VAFPVFLDDLTDAEPEADADEPVADAVGVMELDAASDDACPKVPATRASIETVHNNFLLVIERA